MGTGRAHPGQARARGGESEAKVVLHEYNIESDCACSPLATALEKTVNTPILNDLLMFFGVYAAGYLELSIVNVPPLLHYSTVQVIFLVSSKVPKYCRGKNGY